MVTMGQKMVLNDLCEITSSKRIFANDYQSEGVPFYRSKEIIEKHKGALEVSTEIFISENKFIEIKKKFGAPKPGDLLLTSVGTIGVPYVVKCGEEFYFKDGNLTWFRNFKNLDSQFLHYWLLSPLGKGELQKCTIGSSQSALTIVLLKGMQIQLPPLPNQRKIASILSAYDDLIENNTRRIKVLEEMAQMIYREWFVKFRFPGHEKVKMVDSPMGMIPEGWEVVRVGELLEKTPRKKKIQKQDYIEQGEFPVVDQGKEFIGGYTSDIEAVIEKPLPLIVFGDHTRILKYIDFPFACGADGTQLLKANTSRMPASLFYYALLAVDLSNFAYARHFKFLKEEQLIVPDQETASMFEKHVSKMHDHISCLTKKNQNLRQTRDLLLPKLISGTVYLENINIGLIGGADAKNN